MTNGSDATEPEAGKPEVGKPEEGKPEVGKPEAAEHEGAGPIAPTAGLCSRCVHARLIVSGRGSRFVLCEQSRTNDHFPRYPALPVVACTGFERAGSRT